MRRRRRLYSDRTAGRHRHHRGADRPAVARRPASAGGRPADAVPEQSQADRPGVAQLSRGRTKQFPPAYLTANSHADGSAYGISYGDEYRNGPTGCGWGVFLLPYLEQDNLYRQFDMKEPCWAPAIAAPGSTKVSVFLCPSATGGSDGFEVQTRPSITATAVPIMRSDGSRSSSPTPITSPTPASTSRGDGRRPTATTTTFPNRFPRTAEPLARIDGPFYRNSRITVAR